MDIKTISTIIVSSNNEKESTMNDVISGIEEDLSHHILLIHEDNCPGNASIYYDYSKEMWPDIYTALIECDICGTHTITPSNDNYRKE